MLGTHITLGADHLVQLQQRKQDAAESNKPEDDDDSYTDAALTFRTQNGTQTFHNPLEMMIPPKDFPVIVVSTKSAAEATARFSDLLSRLQSEDIYNSTRGAHLFLDCFVELDSIPSSCAALRNELTPMRNINNNDNEQQQHGPRVVRVPVLWCLHAELHGMHANNNNNNNTTLLLLSPQDQEAARQRELTKQSIQRALREAGIRKAVLLTVPRNKEGGGGGQHHVDNDEEAAKKAVEKQHENRTMGQALVEVLQLESATVHELPRAASMAVAVVQPTQQQQQQQQQLHDDDDDDDSVLCPATNETLSATSATDITTTTATTTAQNQQQQEISPQQRAHQPQQDDVEPLLMTPDQQEAFARTLDGTLAVVIAPSHAVAYDWFLQEREGETLEDQDGEQLQPAPPTEWFFRTVCFSAAGCSKSSSNHHSVGPILADFLKPLRHHQEQQQNKHHRKRIVVASVILSGQGDSALRCREVVEGLQAMLATSNRSKKKRLEIKYINALKATEKSETAEIWRRVRDNSSQQQQQQQQQSERQWCTCRNTPENFRLVFGEPSSLPAADVPVDYVTFPRLLPLQQPVGGGKLLPRGAVRAVILDVAVLRMLVAPIHRCCLQQLFVPVLTRQQQQHQRNRHTDVAIIVLAADAAEFETAMALLQSSADGGIFFQAPVVIGEHHLAGESASPIVSVFGNRRADSDGAGNASPAASSKSSSKKNKMGAAAQEQQRQQQQHQQNLARALAQAHNEIPFDANKAFVLCSALSTGVEAMFSNAAVFSPADAPTPTRNDDGDYHAISSSGVFTLGTVARPAMADRPKCCSSWTEQYKEWRHCSVRNEAVDGAAELVMPTIAYQQQNGDLVGNSSIERRRSGGGGEAGNDDEGIVFSQLKSSQQDSIRFDHFSGITHYAARIGKVISASPQHLRQHQHEEVDSTARSSSTTTTTTTTAAARLSTVSDPSPTARANSAEVLIAPMVFGQFARASYNARKQREQEKQQQQQQQQQEDQPPAPAQPTTTTVMIFSQDTIRSGKELFDNPLVRRQVELESERNQQQKQHQQDGADSIISATVRWDGAESTAPASSVKVFLSVSAVGGKLLAGRCSMCSVVGQDASRGGGICCTLRSEMPQCRHLAASWFALRSCVMSAASSSSSSTSHSAAAAATAAVSRQLWPVAQSLPIAAMSNINTTDHSGAPMMMLTPPAQNLLNRAAVEIVYLWFAVASCPALARFCKVAMGVDESALLDNDDSESPTKKTKKKKKNDDDDDDAATVKRREYRQTTSTKIKNFFALCHQQNQQQQQQDQDSSSSSSRFSDSVLVLTQFLVRQLHSTNEPVLENFVSNLLLRLKWNVDQFKASGAASAVRSPQRRERGSDGKYKPLVATTATTAVTATIEGGGGGDRSPTSLSQQQQQQQQPPPPHIQELKVCSICPLGENSIPLRDHSAQSRFNLHIRRTVDGSPCELNAAMQQRDLLSLQRLLVAPPTPPCEKCQSTRTDMELRLGSAVSVFFLEIQFTGRPRCKQQQQQQQEQRQQLAAADRPAMPECLVHLQVSNDSVIDFNPSQNDDDDNNDSSSLPSFLGRTSSFSGVDPVVTIQERQFRLSGFIKGTFASAGIGAATKIDECGVVMPQSDSSSSSSNINNTASPTSATTRRRPWTLLSRAGQGSGETHCVNQLDALRRALTVHVAAADKKGGGGEVPFLTLRFDEVTSRSGSASPGRDDDDDEEEEEEDHVPAVHPGILMMQQFAHVKADCFDRG